jgi:SAM-dependent methyltransferase
MKASDPAVTEELARHLAKLRSLGWYHSIELANGEVIPGLQSPAQLHARLQQFPIPRDLKGKRVLDIGAWDGWFSFEMEKRGASVVAVDLVLNEKLLLARQLLGSNIDCRVANVYDLREEEYGHFDVVLFFGVLYHLKHPLLALERVCALGADLVCVESYVTDDGSNPAAKPHMEFYEKTELCGQFDNWVGPNSACLLSFCRTAGFVRVRLESVIDNRAHVTCHRKWDAAGGDGPAPYIVSAENSVSRGRTFSRMNDDYVSIWFKTPHTDLSEEDVFPEIGEYAARPAVLYSTGGDGWHAIVKLPPGIGSGWQGVRLRVRDSAHSNTARIGVEVGELEQRQPIPGAPPGRDFRIEIVADGKTWERNQIWRRPGGGALSVWVRGLSTPCDRSQVWVCLGGATLPSVFVSEPDPAGLRQVNALLPAEIPVGMHDVRIAVGECITPPLRVEINQAERD